jgi:hypothetical protein
MPGYPYSSYPLDFRVNDHRAEPGERLAALREAARGGVKTGEVNNHIHTIYSFSPYTPSMAALLAENAGLEAAGSVDHDSVGAAEEMLAACAALDIGGCCGFEVRVSFRSGPFRDRKINNPDSEGIAYMTVQGIPEPALPGARDFLAPLRSARLLRTYAMTARLNDLLADAGFPASERIDAEEDVLGHSQYAAGGGVTERHLLAAAARLFIRRRGKGPQVPQDLKTKFGFSLPAAIEKNLSDPANPHYLFDLVGALKTTLLPAVFIQPEETECVPARTVTDFARAIGAVPAYAYLGDVGESPTGDKAAERFEDSYLDELFAELSGLGYCAVTYMPPRNSLEQLRRVRRLCAEKGFMEISGVDINSSRQSFSCPEVLRPDFRHLVDTTWALVAHERLASLDSDLALFSPENPLRSEPLSRRLSVYAALGRELDRARPRESALSLAKKLQKG